MVKQPGSFVYKILSASDWNRAEQLGYTQTDLDEGDGYVHLSTREQVSETLQLHYKGQTGVGLFEFALDDIENAIRWESSRGGQLFPHLYGRLHLSKARRRWHLDTGDDQVPALPQDIDQ